MSGIKLAIEEDKFFYKSLIDVSHASLEVFKILARILVSNFTKAD